MAHVAGLVLAGGAGTRFGGPKALAVVDGELLGRRAVDTLLAGGCSPVTVVLGAQADDVRKALGDKVSTVYAPDWETGMAASLRAGMAAVGALDPLPDAVLVHLVDLPWVGSDVVARLVEMAEPAVLARADYGAGPGHPVLCGRDWWPEFVASVHGDHGAREFLAQHKVQRIPCADLGDGSDVDYPQDLNR